jgi:hypothetical protein
MIKIEKIETYGWEAAIRGMRNPMNSWDKSDSHFEWGGKDFSIGEADLALMKKLVHAGSDHRKFLRQIMVSMDITAPLYWWKEFDTYKVGTVANSCSTMHKIHEKEFTLDDFSHDHLVKDGISLLLRIIDDLNDVRELYLNYDEVTGSGDCCEENRCKKDVWWQMIQLLPSSYNQLRTVTMNYEVLLNMYRARKDHKLDEWQKFCDTIAELPYFKDFIDKGD